MLAQRSPTLTAGFPHCSCKRREREKKKRYLLHNARFALGKGDVASALVLNILDFDLSSSCALVISLGRLVLLVIVITVVVVAVDLLELLVDMRVVSAFV